MKNSELDFSLPMNKGLEYIQDRILSLKKYLKFSMTGYCEIGYLASSGGLDDQEWEWVEDILIIKDILNDIKD